MKHLILFSIGPVQSFIAQARKTHDLYAGSMLLSDLVKKAIETIGENNLIFPKLGEAMPNRFLAEVPKAETNLQAFGERVEKAVRTEWEINIANDALKGINKKPDGFNEQIKGLLEIFWVIVPLESDDKYIESVFALEKNLAAIKNIRSFSQYGWQSSIVGEQGRKCSLDGQRNVQFYRPKNGKDHSETASPLYSTPNGVCISTHFPDAVLQPGEGLSAVSFAKRRYQYAQTSTFKSTAEIALLDALDDLEKNTAGNILLKEYRKQIFSEFNAQLYLEDALTSDFLTKQGISFKNGYNLEDARQKRKTLQDIAEFKFQKYYAVLTFDGDDMGEWLSGKKLTDKNSLRGFQEEFAKCLADFAKFAKTRLNTGSGQTVYAGGDDFLGFVNLNHLLAVLKYLRNLFHEKVDIPLAGFKTDKISFSAGICVAHYKEPLSLVLQEARNAQKKAKDLDKDKDALAISVIKGSGENHIAVLPFGENSKNVERLQTLTQTLLSEDFSNTFIKTMQLEFERVMDFRDDRAAFEELFQTELRRLLQRAARSSWSKEQKKQEAQTMSLMLMEMLGTNSTENFFQMLHTADFFHRELDTPKEELTKQPQTV